MALAVKENIEKRLKVVLGDEEGTAKMKELIANKKICTESWG